MGRDPNTKGNRLWEEEMVAEYLAATFPGERILSRVRLGPRGTSFPDPTLTEEELRLLGAAFRRWADAIVITARELLVIEVGILPDPRDISLLQTYLMLVDHTPELDMVAALPRRGLLVWAVDDPFSRTVAVRAGLSVEIFKPSFFLEYLQVVRARERRGVPTRLPSPSSEGT